MPIKIQLRRGLSEDWKNSNPVLAEGELCVETDTKKFKIGDGIRQWNDIEYSTGIKGDKGDQGIQGINGLPGITGNKGDRGEVGPQGTQGITGSQGPKGDRGEKGEIGKTGEKGDKGSQGPAGIDGIDGITPDIKPIETKITKFQDALQKDLQNYKVKINSVISSKGFGETAGSGSYWLNDLGDTNKTSIKNAVDGDVLTFSAAEGKWISAPASGSAPVSLTSPSFSYTNGLLSQITYPGGQTKTFTYNNGLLSQINQNMLTYIIRKTFNYTNGTLTSITQETL